MTSPVSELLPPSVRSVVVPTRPGLTDREAFEDAVRELTFRRLRIAGIAYACVHVLSSALVALMSVSALSQWLLPRAAIVAVSLGMSALTWAPRLQPRAFALSVILTLITAAYVLVPILRFGLGWGSDHGGLVLLIVCTGLLFPYTERQALAVTGAIFALYLGAAATAFQPGDLGWLLEGGFYVLSASAIVVVGARLAHRLRRGEFSARAALSRERDNAEQLLLNVLPRPIVERLKKDQSAIADGFKEATVMFADIVGFTPLAAELGPKRLVEMLGELFSRFDALTEKHGLEKIKTIGDAYMVAGGLPIPRSDHALAIAKMALELRETTSGMTAPTGAPLQVRIGINTGPVAAGVIGTKKFIYDLWGDTVNIAARMESSAEPGMIQVTQHTYETLRSHFHFEPRGKVIVKGKGPMHTWLLVGPHRPLT